MSMIDMPFSAFEELFLMRDHIDAPSTFFVKIELRDPLDRAAAQAALDKVCELHPLASCKAKKDSNGRCRWVFEPKPVAIQWNDKDFCYPTSWIDLFGQRPLNVTCFTGTTGGTTMLFHVHHVAFDGLGFLQLLRDWWAIYLGQDCEVPRYDPGILNERSRPNISFLKALRLLPGQWKSIRATIQVLGRKVIPFHRANMLPSLDPVVPGVISRSLSTDRTTSLRELARSKNVSANSVMARNLYTAISRWHERTDIPTNGSHYRLVIPFNERRVEHHSMSACNHCTVISFDRSPTETSDPEKLLSGIDQEVRTIQRWRLSLNFWRALNCMRFFPGGLKKNASTERVTATSLFSNLGRLERAGKIFASEKNEPPEVIEIEVVPTMPRGMTIAIVAYELHGRMKLTMQYDRRVLSETEAAKFMDQFMEPHV